MKRSVVFPDGVNEVLNTEAKRQGISFNKVVVQACMEKYAPDSYLPWVADRSDGGLREIDYAGDASKLHKEVRINGEDVLRIEQLAAEARLSVTELIRRFARIGKVEVNEVIVPGLDRFHTSVIPLMEELAYLIEELNPISLRQTSDILALRDKAEELLNMLKEVRRDLYQAKRRLYRKLDERK